MSGSEVGALVTCGLFVIAHTGALVWWASRVTNQIEGLQRDLRELKAEIVAARTQTAQIAEIYARLGALETAA